jgi:hypothetical protein
MRLAVMAPVAALAVAFALVGCGSNNGTTHLMGVAGNSGPGAAGSPEPGTAGNGSMGSAGSGSMGSAGSSGDAGTGGPGAAGAGMGAAGNPGAAGRAGGAVCLQYCNTIMTNCKGVNAQYADQAECMKACSYMPNGSPNDANVNSAYCRANKAAEAATDTMAVKSACFLSGPLSYGACGNDCDVFCAIATDYCTAAGGYNGTPPYTSMDDCENTCGQYQRVLDFGTPGSYTVNYSSGKPVGDPLTDTLECRAYHLIINALASPANQAVHCAHAANMSAPCGPGVMAIDAGTTTPTDGPVYNGTLGMVHVYNASNWDDTPTGNHPRDKRKMLLRDEGDPHLVMIDLSKTPILQWKTVAGGPWARASQLIGNNQILGGRNDGYEVFDYNTGAITKTVNSFGNTQSAYRTIAGETMLTRSGTILTFLDKTDKMSHQISYPGYGYVRVARPTRKGTYLVPSDTKLFEGDATGKVLWSTSGSGWSHIWEPLMLGPSVGGGKWNEGDTLLCTAFGSSCDVVDQKTHMVTFRFGTKQMPEQAMVHPNFFSEYEILPNGNIFTSNWQGHGGGNGGIGLQVLEFDPTGKLIWYWKQDPTIFSSIQGVQVMDGKDPTLLHVQETSPDSTWQPVMP